MKAAIYTLGCKVNQYESQEIASSLENAGFEITDAKSKADVYIINSCTVTAESSRKSRQSLRKFRNEHPEAVIVLTGCYSQAFPEETGAFEEADIVIGNHTNDVIPEAIFDFLITGKKIRNVVPHKKDDAYKGNIITSFEGHTRAFIKIQDGCNRYCTYCIIPTSRGFSRSKPLCMIEKEIGLLADKGFKELVFVGINLSSYGKDIGLNICDALEIAENTDGIERIRLGSLEPDHITDEVIERLAKMKKFCPQFHLSLQSGCDRILKKMNRHYDTGEYLMLCKKLKENFPDVSLTTDIIPGFPGETEEDFAETVRFAEKVGFMKVHVFPFSPREGTPAYSYSEKIPNEIKNERCAILQKKADALRREFLKEYVGKTVEVLFETPKNGYQQGYTPNYTPVAVKSDTVLTGEIKKVKITEIKAEICMGTLE